jgi:hypothetical protein
MMCRIADASAHPQPRPAWRRPTTPAATSIADKGRPTASVTSPVSQDLPVHRVAWRIGRNSEAFGSPRHEVRSTVCLCRNRRGGLVLSMDAGIRTPRSAAVAASALTQVDAMED